MSHHWAVQARAREPPAIRATCLRLRHPPPAYGLACFSWPTDRWTAKANGSEDLTSGLGIVNLEVKEYKNAFTSRTR